MYKCLRSDRFSLNEYTITSIRPEDVFLIKNWRNAQIDILRQDKVLSDEDQKKYFDGVIAPSFSESNPRQILLSFLKDDIAIGYGGIVHISWQDKRGEISFLLDNKRVADQELYRKEFTIFLNLIKQMAFDDLQFNRIYTETFDIRPFHISVLEQNGFLMEGRMKKHISINNLFHDSLIHGLLKEYYDVQG